MLTQSLTTNLLHEIIEHKGGVNDYGSWIVKYEKCNEIFDLYICREVNDSSLTSGGQIIGKYDKEIYSDEEIDEEVKKSKRKIKNSLTYGWKN